MTWLLEKFLGYKHNRLGYTEVDKKHINLSFTLHDHCELSRISALIAAQSGMQGMGLPSPGIPVVMARKRVLMNCILTQTLTCET